MVDSVIKASPNEGFPIQDRDIVGITESVVARAQNYASVMPSQDVRKKSAVVLWSDLPYTQQEPLCSCLRGIAKV